ncbi:MAG: DUF3224 domain-containing protein [Candidatus Hermodarchaeota archaeon]|nr:DUF3224 domain-containing protein [Candidatus Hermodarchaeota archaeon]
MKSKLTTAILLSVLSCILLTPMTVVSATKPTYMTVFVSQGVPELVFEPLPSGHWKVSLSTTQEWTGDWEGTISQSGTGIIRFMFSDEPPGKPVLILDCFGEFTGTIQGKTGTVIYYMRNNVDLDGEYFSAIITILGGTGELENIHGHGTVVGDGILGIWVHFDPS